MCICQCLLMPMVQYANADRPARPARKEPEMSAKPEPKFTDLDMEAALCAWECLCENRENPTYAPLFDAHGTGAMRHAAIYAGAVAQAVYGLMEAQRISCTGAYDWTFVPAVLDRLDWPKLIEHRLYAGKSYEPDTKSILDQILEAMPAEFHKETPEEWTSSAEAEAQRLWSYPALISDHPEAAQHAQANHECPKAFAKALGEDLDLIPADVWKTGA